MPNYFMFDRSIHIEKALRDLGASVKLLPYSVYKQIDLGELKPIPVTPQLVNKSEGHPKASLKTY